MNTPRCILVVEDHDIDLKVATRVLRKAWPQVSILEAHNGEEAIAVLEQCNGIMPDIILLDVNMPRMDGFEFLQAWYADVSIEIPVVMMLTSSSLEADRERTTHYSCVKSYIVKPITKAIASQLPELAA